MTGSPAPFFDDVYNPNVPLHLNMTNMALYNEHVRLNRKLSTLQRMFFARSDGIIYYTNIV